MIPNDTHLQIGALLFEGLDQIDLTGPFEVQRIIGPNTVLPALPLLALSGTKSRPSCYVAY